MAWVCIRSESIPLPVGQPQRSPSDWPMLGGNVSRNGVQPFAKNLPTEWAVAEGERKNVRWVADLGYRTYSSPIVAEGRVFIGTNNFKPRDPKYMEFNKRTGRKEAIDLGVLCRWFVFMEMLEAGNWRKFLGSPFSMKKDCPPCRPSGWMKSRLDEEPTNDLRKTGE